MQPLLVRAPAGEKPTAIHRNYCPRCPSRNGPNDPEAEDIAKWVQRGEVPAMDAVFVCAWRPTKLCRGICEQLGVKEPIE